MTQVLLSLPTVRRGRAIPVFLDCDDDPFAEGALRDKFGRVHKDLRISVTDRCSLRCTYCMPADGVPWMPKVDMLSRRELTTVAEVAARLGIEEIRLTGGEPLLRADIAAIIRDLSRIDTAAGRKMRISMTTNGLRLPMLMDDLVDAGLERVNISLDTVDREKYEKLTRRDKFDQAVAGIDAARKSGLRPLKINAVAMRGVNDDEVCALTQFALEYEAELRFIEQMPLDGGHTWQRATMMTGEEILGRLEKKFELNEKPGRGASPAAVYTIDGGPHTVGVIASVTKPFCGFCDRVRLTADGQLRNCLFAREEQDMRTLLRDDSLHGEKLNRAIARVFRSSIAQKKPGHGINDPGFLQPDRPMSAIGG